ncbi:phytase [Cytophagales bacterium WSM2-2]|nr:phytase [Cytophagales bacterium WSM2-2]
MKVGYKFLVLVLSGLVSVQSFGQSLDKLGINKLRFINQYEIPYNQNFKNTVIGGLSGIDYDPDKDVYYILSDDRSDINPVRFYTAKIGITERGISEVNFTDVHFLLHANGEKFASFKQFPERAVDPEDIRYHRKKGLIYWTSEGERILSDDAVILNDPAILVAKPDGSYSNTIPLPENLRPRSTEYGSRRNGTIESLSFTSDFSTMFTALEEPLYEDGPRADHTKTNSWSRIYQFDAKQKLVAQYAYALESVAYPAVPETGFKVNGISALLAISDKKILTVERSFSVGRQPCTIKVFLTDLSQADNIADVSSLKEKPPVHPAKKELLLNMDDLGIFTDNVEGITFGPKLPNGNLSLLFITDNNFQERQKQQVLLFEVDVRR